MVLRLSLCAESSSFSGSTFETGDGLSVHKAHDQDLLTYRLNLLWGWQQLEAIKNQSSSTGMWCYNCCSVLKAVGFRINLEAGDGLSGHEAHGQDFLGRELRNAARHLHAFHSALHNNGVTPMESHQAAAAAAAPLLLSVVGCRKARRWALPALRGALQNTLTGTQS